VSLTVTRIVTADELLTMPVDGFRYELVKGELIRMSPTGHEHGVVAMNIAGPLHQHVKSNVLGVVYAAETGFLLTRDPDTVRAPDVAFVNKARIDQVADIKGYWIGAPDLAVEVISPSDTLGYLEDKVAEWLDAGVRMVWVASPKLRSVAVYRSLNEIVMLTDKDTLDGSDVVPGFTMAVSEVFAGIQK
jgi:Uma2 family endonuclease